MADREDSRPFAALRQNAEDFQASFAEDVTNCLALLNTKISALLCDPDSLLSSPSDARRLSAHMEFSKAKYEIYVNMKSHFDELENGWLDQIADMKTLFLENVEIFLAGTKLEVKIPPSENAERRRSSPAVSRIRKGRQDSPSTSVSSLYPTALLLNTAKHIPVLSSLLPNVQDKDEDSENSEEETAVATPLRPNGKPLKRVTINTSPTIREFLASSKIMDDDEDMDSEEDEKEDVPVKRNERSSRKSTLNTPTLKKMPANSKVATSAQNVEENSEEPVKKNGRATRKSTVSTPNSSRRTPVKSSLRMENLVNTERESTESSSSEEKVNTPLRRINVVQKEKYSSESGSSEEKSGTPVAEPEVKTTRRRVRSQLAVETVSSPAPRRTRTPRRNLTIQEIDITDDNMEINNDGNDEDMQGAAHQGTPKNVNYSVGFNVNEDLDIYSPVVNLTKSGSRRKTMLNRVADNFEDVSLTPDLLRSKSKRKTIASDTAVPSPKRLKRGNNRSSIVPSKLALEPDEPMESNLLESDGSSETGHYSPWIPLGDITGRVPAVPGMYELKVASAKKPAYIGGCESLRQKLTLHKLVQNSGHKHLDKFIERNIANILVRYEQLPSAAEAKTEEKNRVKSFVALHKNTPAYN